MVRPAVLFDGGVRGRDRQRLKASEGRGIGVVVGGRG